ncbi:hypothetical protein HYR99_38555 [Candidatus Poribacteria bacterium]|nr:hypothetical protein [Candidatus Poribacteria bacterium]
MYIDYFIWLPDILEKLVVRHHVMQDEDEILHFVQENVEEVFFNSPCHRFVESRYRPGEAEGRL